MQIGPPSGHFANRVHMHPIGRADDPHHLPFGQDFAAPHAGSLGHMLHALGRFLLGHLQIIRRTLLPIAVRVAAAFVDLASDDFAQVLIILKFNSLLLAFLAFLLIAAGFFFGFGVLEEFGLDLE